MKKIALLAFCLSMFGLANAQISKGEHFLGGTVNISDNDGSGSLTLLPEYWYAIGDQDILGLAIGYISRSVPDVSYTIFRPSYTKTFPIEDNFFWFLNGYLDLSFGDQERVAPGVSPGLGYRVHKSTVVVLRGGGISYDFKEKYFDMGVNTANMGMSVYFRIAGK
ncbi:MAG: hypothetical protein RIC30_11505 [Marinoscillum sp.]|uniref:hypothetical protein n=1 Tax=Marinoscillum sp. TaxID=2024838 RepID=UPI0032F357ED